MGTLAKIKYAKGKFRLKSKANLHNPCRDHSPGSIFNAVDANLNETKLMCLGRQVQGRPKRLKFPKNIENSSFNQRLLIVIKI